MKNIKKLLSIMIIALLVVTAIPIQAEAAVKISATKKTMYVGDTMTLKVTGTKAKVKWSSSNKNVASVTKKGKVSAKQSGTATITAKVKKKTLKCKVTVKAKFSASEATKNISCTFRDTGKGVVAILKNNNKIAVSLEAKMAYYSGGKIIGTTSNYNYAFESGSECALFFDAPLDGDYNYVKYNDFKITMSIEEGTNLITGAKNISVSSDFGADNVSAEVTNNSGNKLSSIIVACVFYDSDGNAIGYDYHYANCETAGSLDYMTFSFPYDENYDTITPSSYKIYVNSAYSYTWEQN